MRLISTENHGLSRARNTGLRGRDGRDRRLHRRRRLPRPALADATWPRRFADRRTRRVGGPEHPAARRRPRRRLRRERAGRAGPRAAHRRRGRAHPRLQHGVPPRARWRRSAASTRSSAPPATTWTSAGGCRSAGWTLGFTPAAVVWHHRRDSVRAYWQQQRGYGKAEALLERKWPRTTTRRPPHLGRAPVRERLGPVPRAAPLARLPRHLGHATSSSRSTSRPTACCRALPLMPEWYLRARRPAGPVARRAALDAACSWPCRCSRWPSARLLVDAALGARRASVVRRADVVARAAAEQRAGGHALHPAAAGTPLRPPAARSEPVPPARAGCRRRRARSRAP